MVRTHRRRFGPLTTPATHPPLALRGAWLSLLALATGVMLASPATNSAAEPLSPTAVAIAPDGSALYLACATANRLVTLDPASGAILRDTTLPAAPSGVTLSSDGARLYVTCAAPVSTICIVDTITGEIVDRLQAGHTALAPILSPDGRTLHVCNRFDHTVSSFDLANRTEARRVAVPREPIAAAVTLDGRRLLVANHLPAGRADLDYVAATVSIVDVGARTVAGEIRLPNGSGLLRDVRLSPDGRHAVVTHQLSRYHLPTTQVERGWINTSALSVIDIRAMQRINTVLLDNIDAGAANPWATAWTPDGRTLCVTHAGTHEVSAIDFPALLARLALVANGIPEAAAGQAFAARSAAEVPDDLSFLVGLRQRIKCDDVDRGPRAVQVRGNWAYVANYFSDSVSVVDLCSPGATPKSLPLQPPRALSAARRGEILFNDATLCFQGWQSCASCHSSDARVDGLNWDNLNDGIGNPKNAKSLLYAHVTPPSMWLRVREDASVAVRAGIRFSLFTVRSEADAEDIDAYLDSLEPIPSPRLVNGALSPAAARGKETFLAQSTGCAGCHPPARFFTDLESHDVGTRGRYDKPADRFDTPMLIELWRSAPYLHDGSAATVRDVLVFRNRAGRHGHTGHLARGEIDDLVEYLLSL